MLQTSNTGVCSKCLSHTGSAPAHGACSLPAHTAQALGCSAGNHRGWPWAAAPPRSKLLRFRHSGSPQRHRLGWACILCPSQVRAAQVMRCLASTIAATYRLPAAQFSGCTTSTPSQVDVDRPEPQEVLVSKEACLLFFFFFSKLYNIVLVLSNIEMNPPQVYLCSPSWTLLPPPSPYPPSGSSQCTSPKHPASCIEPGLASRFIHDIIHAVL